MSDKIEQIVFYSIDRVYRKKQQYAAQKFSEHGIDITPEQWVVLKVVDQYDGIQQVELADKAAKDTASITRILDILQKKGFVERRPAENDRRAYAVHATKKGKSLLKQNIDFVIGIREQATKGISKADMDTLKAIMKKMEENMT